jgi:hypothetical protein
VKEGRRPHGGLGMVAHLLRYLGGLQDALPQKSEASPAIALALKELQPGDLPFQGAENETCKISAIGHKILILINL